MNSRYAIQNPTSRHARMFASAAAALALAGLGATSIASAQIVFPKPAAPAAVLPANGSLERAASPNLTQLAFRWNQSGAFGTPSQPLPTQFVICLMRAGDPPCAYPGTFLVPATGGTPIYNNLQVVGYAYNYTAQNIADTFIDRALTWAMGSCVGARCSYTTTSRSLWLTSKELYAIDVQESFNSGPASGQFEITAQGDNRGSTASGTTSTEFVMWGVYNDGPGRCLTNPNRPGLNNADEVITNNGSQIPLGMLGPPGARVAPANTIAIRPAGGSVDYTIIADSQSLPAGAMSGNLATWRKPFPAVTLPVSYVVRIYVDSSNVLRELNESDNWRAECLTYQ